MPATRSPSDARAPSGAALLLLVLLAAVRSSAIADAPVRLAAEGPDRDPPIGALRHAIETAFGECDAAPLKTFLSRRVKTFLSSRALGARHGYYGADQVLMILRRAFRDRATLRFRLGSHDDPDALEGRFTLAARWLYRDEGTSKSEARLSFTVVREGAAWTIREIRELK